MYRSTVPHSWRQTWAAIGFLALTAALIAGCPYDDLPPYQDAGPRDDGGPATVRLPTACSRALAAYRGCPPYGLLDYSCPYEGWAILPTESQVAACERRLVEARGDCGGLLVALDVCRDGAAW